MKKIFNEKDFIQGFARMGRPNRFSKEAFKKLHEYYLKFFVSNKNDGIEFDIFGLCSIFSIFTEYSSVQACADDNGIKAKEGEEITLKELSQHINVIAALDNGGVLVCNN